MNKSHLLLGAAALAVAISVSQPVFAQEASSATSTEEGSDAESATSGESQAIVVTGSRIRRDSFNSPSPISVLTRDDSTVAGFNSTAEILQSSSVTAGARQIDSTFTGFIVGGGPGTNTLSLRSLGPARTLIMLNGRRLGPSGTSGSVAAVDLNVLPNAIVDRIEILKDGASSIYGSDAIAGVVNIVTDRNLKGLYVRRWHLGSGSRSGHHPPHRGDRWL